MATSKGGKYTPPSNREHPPKGKGSIVGGVHSPVQVHNVNKNGGAKKTRGKAS